MGEGGRRPGEGLIWAGVKADVITDFICFTPYHPLKTAKNLISSHNFLWTNHFTKRKVKNMKTAGLQSKPSIN
jgi:hypothetical protein